MYVGTHPKHKASESRLTSTQQHVQLQICKLTCSTAATGTVPSSSCILAAHTHAPVQGLQHTHTCASAGRGSSIFAEQSPRAQQLSTC